MILFILTIFRSYYWQTGKHYSDKNGKITQELYEELQLIYSWDYEYKKYYNEKLRKMYTTNISQKTLSNFKSKIDSLHNMQSVHYFKNELRYLMFSGHDDNVYPLMRAFGLTSPQCLQSKYTNKFIQKKVNVQKEDRDCRLAPGFASSFLFELSFVPENTQSKFFVRVKFNGKPLDLSSKCKNAVN